MRLVLFNITEHQQMNIAKKTKTGMTLIVKTVAAWLRGLIFLYGIYVVVSGSALPGGAFPAGVIITSSFILVVLSHGRKIGLRKLTQRKTTILTGTGVLIFLLAALAGLFIADIFFLNLTSPAHHPQPLLNVSLMFIYELGITLLVSMSLLLLFSIMAGPIPPPLLVKNSLPPTCWHNMKRPPNTRMRRHC